MKPPWKNIMMIIMMHDDHDADDFRYPRGFNEKH